MAELELSHKVALFMKKEFESNSEKYLHFDDFIGEVCYEVIELCCSHCVNQTVSEAEELLKGKK